MRQLTAYRRRIAPAFDHLLAQYTAEWDPHGTSETHEVEQLAACRWRMYRIATIEAGVVGVSAARLPPAVAREFERADTGTRIALAFEHRADNGQALALLGRYEARLNRQYRQSLRELRRLQDERKHKLPNEPKDLVENAA